MSPRTPIALALLCAALGAALWLAEHLSPSEASQRTRTLSPLSAAQIERFSISSQGQDCSLARRAGGARTEWAFLNGWTHRRVDGATVEAALAELELATQAGHVEGATPGAQHGLAPPRIQLTLHGRDGTPLVVGFGGEAGPGRVFAALADRLFVVSARLSTVWGRGCEDLVDLRVFERSLASVRKIRIGELSLARPDQDADWRVSPHDALADQDVVGQILGILSTLRVGAPHEGATLVLEVEDETGRQRAGIAASAPDALRLQQLSTRLPSRHPLLLRAATATRVALRREDEHVLLARAPGEAGWQVGRATALDAPLAGFVAADEPRVHSLITDLARLVAHEHLAPPATAPGPAAWRVRIADDRRVHELELRPHARGLLLLTVRGFGARYVVQSAPFERLAATVLYWRERALWSVPTAAVEAVTVGEVELRRDDHFRWQRVRPSAAEADAARAHVVVRLLSRPPVEAFAPLSPLTGPTTTLAIETIDGTTRHRHGVEVALTATSQGHACLVDGALAYLPAAFLARVLELTR